MIAGFFSLIGVPGTLALLLWIAAVAIWGIAWRRPRRERWLLAALALAVAGRLCSVWGEARIMTFRLDRTDEVRAAQEAQQKFLAAQEEAHRQSGNTGVRFAEDAPGESMDQAIMTPAAEPAYRAAGRQKRAVGTVDAKAARLANRAAEADPSGETVRTLKLDDYRLANRMVRLGTLIARALLAFCAATLLVDFLRRFNRPFDNIFPVPVAGRWLLQFSPPALDVLWERPSDMEMERFLSRVARKGHAFLYFGPRAAAADTRRLRLGRWGCWRLPLLRWGDAGLPREAEFLVDAVWFGHYAIRVESDEAVTVLREVTQLLCQRQHSRAWARRLPHVVWDTGAPIPADIRPALAAACRETGVRLVEVSPR